jgi:hypothetical protein
LLVLDEAVVQACAGGDGGQSCVVPQGGGQVVGKGAVGLDEFEGVVRAEAGGEVAGDGSGSRSDFQHGARLVRGSGLDVAGESAAQGGSAGRDGSRHFRGPGELPEKGQGFCHCG